jgi:hypothetical protein
VRQIVLDSASRRAPASSRKDKWNQTAAKKKACGLTPEPGGGAGRYAVAASVPVCVGSAGNFDFTRRAGATV